MKKKVSDIQDIELIKMALENDQKAYIVNMNGNSYRFKETEEWLKSH